MCDPLTIAGIASTVGSIAMNKMAENKIAKARSSAVNAETDRQRGYNDEIFALNDESQDRYQNFEGKRGAQAETLADFYGGESAPLPQAGQAVPTSASNVVVQERQKQIDKAKAYGGQQDRALAELRSFGDILGDISREQAQDASLINTISGFKRGSQGVLPLEFEAANNKGGGLKLFADVLGGAGQISTMAGLSGAKIPGLGGGTPSSAASAAAGGWGNSPLGEFGQWRVG